MEKVPPDDSSSFADANNNANNEILKKHAEEIGAAVAGLSDAHLAANPVNVQLFSSLSFRLWNIAVTRNLKGSLGAALNARCMFLSRVVVIRFACVCPGYFPVNMPLKGMLT